MATNTSRSRLEAGFTILELMIATSVLAVLLLVASTVFIALGNLYNKGVTGTHLQDNVRNIMQNVTGTIQYSNATEVGSIAQTPGQAEAYCIGGQRFSYITGVEQGTSTNPVQESPHVLYQDSYGNGICAPIDLTNPTGGQDLGVPGETLYKFTIQNVGSTYTVETWATLTSDEGSDLTTNGLCNGKAGDQFCFTSDLQTSVQRRL